MTSSGAPVTMSPPGTQQPDHVGRAQRQLEVVRRQNHRERALSREPTQQSHQLDARGHVEKRCRLVEHQEHGFLCQRPRHHHALALAVGDPCEIPIREVYWPRPRRAPMTRFRGRARSTRRTIRSADTDRVPRPAELAVTRRRHARSAQRPTAAPARTPRVIRWHARRAGPSPTVGPASDRASAATSTSRCHSDRAGRPARRGRPTRSRARAPHAVHGDCDSQPRDHAW